jgi:hypothetical protein
MRLQGRPGLRVRTHWDSTTSLRTSGARPSAAAGIPGLPGGLRSAPRSADRAQCGPWTANAEAPVPGALAVPEASSTEACLPSQGRCPAPDRQRSAVPPSEPRAQLAPSRSKARPTSNLPNKSRCFASSAACKGRCCAPDRRSTDRRSTDTRNSASAARGRPLGLRPDYAGRLAWESSTAGSDRRPSPRALLAPLRERGGTRRGTRTRTSLRTMDFESIASTDSASLAFTNRVVARSEVRSSARCHLGLLAPGARDPRLAAHSLAADPRDLGAATSARASWPGRVPGSGRTADRQDRVDHGPRPTAHGPRCTMHDPRSTAHGPLRVELSGLRGRAAPPANTVDQRQSTPPSSSFRCASAWRARNSVRSSATRGSTSTNG